jgi:hypothetical protein
MTAQSHDLIVASFALWAGDWCYLDRLIKENLLKTEREKSVGFDDLFSRLKKSQLNRYKKKRDLFIKEKGLTKFPILETDHIRSTIWYVSDFEYSLKGYLKDLTWEKDFFNNVHPTTILELPPEKTMKMPRFSTVWRTGKNNNCVTRIDDMGLIESTFYICNFDLEKRQKCAEEHFKDVLMKFNDGILRSMTVELKHDSMGPPSPPSPPAAPCTP